MRINGMGLAMGSLLLMLLVGGCAIQFTADDLRPLPDYAVLLNSPIQKQNSLGEPQEGDGDGIFWMSGVDGARLKSLGPSLPAIRERFRSDPGTRQVKIRYTEPFFEGIVTIRLTKIERHTIFIPM